MVIILMAYWGAAVECGELNGTDTSGSDQLHLRKKRFLLFPVNANLLFTTSGNKAMIFKGPGGYFTILELDMYYPLPDYRFRFSKFRLGEVAILPDSSSAAPPPPSTTTTTTAKPETSTAAPAPVSEHHNGQELSPMEVQQYLKDHPGAWVPPGYGKDRSDWFPVESYNQHLNKWHQSNWNTYPSQQYSYRYIPRMKRSSSDSEDEDDLGEDDHFNISHHRDWEHFHHYRERRELYHTLETGIGSKFDFSMKSCIMRAICEAQSFLMPPGKSMVMDVVRILFSVPLKEDLHDEYSKAMREEGLDCHEQYSKHCPISILYLLLFGKFVP
ncbi:uncharacterized protein LOC120425947 [Culex pipiens pallens]|uniref:uncharacterized protein LOC120425947 n=1 Tax=Culex pipiens pallens TaxID=42434 RepID=UPI001953264F|nr:uncharacterized protein LOC120425947 [Culex pipiens pallens]